MPLARTLARRYHGTSISNEDLSQVAYLALVRAVDRFDPDRGSFIAFAVPTILGELRRHFRDTAWAVRVGRGLQERTAELQGAVDLLARKDGRPPTVQELALYLERTEEDVLEAMQAKQAYSASSLDEPAPDGEDDNTTLLGSLGARDAGYERVEDRVAVQGALSQLDDAERRLLELRYRDELTQQDIGQRIGVSQMQVSRLLTATLAKLREQCGAGHAE